MKKTGVFAGVAAVLFCSCFSWAGVEDGGDHYLWLAKTSGAWTAEGEGEGEGEGGYGFYRAMVYRRPGGTVSADKVVVDILKRNDESLTIIKLGSIDLDVSSHKGYIEDISFTIIDDQRMAVLLDIRMNGMNGMILREAFLVSPDGSAKLFVEAEHKDVFEPVLDD